MDKFERLNFSNLFLKHGLPKWIHFHETVLKEYALPIHVVQYEKLKTDLIKEMRSILSFLGFELTKDIELCLRSDFNGNFKRKNRPQEEIYSIYENFTNVQLQEFDYIYDSFLQRFKTKTLIENTKIEAYNKNK